ncbi:DedA family protein [Vallicoccus soli]|uniref:DedA family protein n=1 Tax=Vallicoccus soli TaxID=2339232 RepID=A0A3A3YYX3_9ACTN|nr:DedA family protein [Vallicoccus soli]RJK96022.1 DedA family protein [Vallicoccus soli]
MAEAEGTSGLTGLSGFVLDVIDAAGEVGVGLLTLVETVFPPIPSEVVLPLAGYLAERGRLELWAVLVLSTLGSLLGALLLYGLAARLGQERSTALLARLPLVDAEDVEQATAWFHRHGSAAVLLGRLVPGVRSLVSLPAGATRMPLVPFCLLTLLGSAVWNGLLVGGGVALGTQWRTVERYSGWLDVALVVAVVVALLALVRHRLRKRRRGAAPRA